MSVGQRHDVRRRLALRRRPLSADVLNGSRPTSRKICSPTDHVFPYYLQDQGALPQRLSPMIVQVEVAVLPRAPTEGPM